MRLSPQDRAAFVAECCAKNFHNRRHGVEREFPRRFRYPGTGCPLEKFSRAVRASILVTPDAPARGVPRAMRRGGNTGTAGPAPAREVSGRRPPHPSVASQARRQGSRSRFRQVEASGASLCLERHIWRPCEDFPESSSRRRRSNENSTGLETHAHRQVGCRELIRKLNSPGMIALGTIRAADFISSCQRFPTSRMASAESRAFQPEGGDSSRKMHDSGKSAEQST